MAETFAALERKYRGFTAPVARVEVGGEPISGLGLEVVSVVCETGVGLEAGVCTVVAGGGYELARSRFSCQGALVRGMPVVVRLGYVVTEPVFRGYLYEVEYQLGGGEEPRVTLVCMDVKAAMMGGAVGAFAEAATYRQALEGLFAGGKAKGYGALCAPPPLGLSELETPLECLPRRMDDYEFLVHTAERFGLECFVRGDALLLRRRPDAPGAVLELTTACVRRVCARLRSAGYLRAVEVMGASDDERDTDKKRAAGRAENPLRLAPDDSLAGRLLGQRTLRLFDGAAHDAAAAERLAGAALRKSREQDSLLELETVGLPELRPGYDLTLQKLSPGLDGNWYIATVLHRLDENGFITHTTTRRDL